MRYDMTGDGLVRIVEAAGLRAALIMMPDGDFDVAIGVAYEREDFHDWATRKVGRAREAWAKRATTKTLWRAKKEAMKVMAEAVHLSCLWMSTRDILVVVQDELDYRRGDPTQGWEGTPMAADQL